MAKITIYGKANCPHTKRARDAYRDAEFIDVLKDPTQMDKMLELSNDRRRVPVIVEGGFVTVGYNGGS
ncbi:UXX-star (seleno)protein family 1 [Pseudodesulfovibrio sp. zrk46]|uniref:UXX-star selenoprotein family 1 n=1 Tax=Pseudodesulfovibrio sp. zrk46 TaxID=2725288 RepID=UPI001449287F|nr:UXX-star (seleno)protein family 1 [Pseudodesulfovibrio sp. zrk46]QJB57349.1 glutaredoxin [Pseudodesulfovibrio sp. zrk46]